MTQPPAPLAGQAPAEIVPPPVPQECLAFKLGHEEYGIDILRVQEIRSYEKPTRIAGTPECIKGVINLRGIIVPIVDMRIRLQLAPVHYDATWSSCCTSAGASSVWWSTRCPTWSRCSPSSCVPHPPSQPAWRATCWRWPRSANAC